MGNRVEGNFIGTDATATKPLGNGSGSNEGVRVEDAPSNTIGGTVTGAGNLISNNAGYGISIVNPGAKGNVVQGNSIGADFGSGGPTPLRNRSGFIPMGNQGGVHISDAPGNLIGGTVPEAGNLIAASRGGPDVFGEGIGVDISGPDASGNFVQGNTIGPTLPQGSGIGTNVNLGNAGDGVRITDASGNVIGGAAPGADNLITANGGNGVEIRQAAMGNQVLGNEIGTDPTGQVTPGNVGDGVLIDESPGNTIGGTSAGMGNLIAANGGNGVQIFGPARPATWCRATASASSSWRPISLSATSWTACSSMKRLVT